METKMDQRILQLEDFKQRRLTETASNLARITQFKRAQNQEEALKLQFDKAIKQLDNTG